MFPISYGSYRQTLLSYLECWFLSIKTSYSCLVHRVTIPCRSLTELVHPLVLATAPVRRSCHSCSVEPVTTVHAVILLSLLPGLTLYWELFLTTVEQLCIPKSLHLLLLLRPQSLLSVLPLVSHTLLLLALSSSMPMETNSSLKASLATVD